MAELKVEYFFSVANALKRYTLRMHILSRYFLVSLILSSFFATSFVNAEDYQGPFYIKKQQDKAQSRWNLADWIDQRDRMRMMDLWLSMHSPSPYEFFIGGDFEFGQKTDGTSYTGGRGFLAGYARIFGIEIQREFDAPVNRWFGLFHLRILGHHAQSTNITLEGGAKSEESLGIWSPFAGASASFYFTRNFGIDGIFHHYFPRDGSYEGNRLEGNVFIDFSMVRLFGGYFTDTSGASHSAGHLGTKIFF